MTNDDPLRSYSLEEQEQLTANLERLLLRVHSGEFSTTVFDIRLLEDLHRSIFGGVRTHAGRCRAPGTGSEYVTFGPHRSFRHRDVERSLDRIFEELRKAVASLDANPEDPSFEFTAIRVAVWTHAELIRVHPFEDGNGRASRALMSAVLVRCGLRPIPLEVPKQEYLACLNHYYRANDLDPLIQLCVSLYPL